MVSVEIWSCVHEPPEVFLYRSHPRFDGARGRCSALAKLDRARRAHITAAASAPSVLRSRVSVGRGISLCVQLEAVVECRVVSAHRPPVLVIDRVAGVSDHASLSGGDLVVEARAARDVDGAVRVDEAVDLVGREEPDVLSAGRRLTVREVGVLGERGHLDVRADPPLHAPGKSHAIQDESLLGAQKRRGVDRAVDGVAASVGTLVCCRRSGVSAAGGGFWAAIQQRARSLPASASQNALWESRSTWVSCVS